MEPIERERGEGEGEEEEEEGGAKELTNGGGARPSLPMGKVKRIVRMDREIAKVSAEATLLIALGADLFLASLAAGARDAALRRKRRCIRAEHVRAAAREHPPTAEFLLDCLSEPTPPPPPKEAVAAKAAAAEKPLPRGTRRIDQFFHKPSEAS